jgi:hypothetical protein
VTSTASHRAPASEAAELPFAGLLFELRDRGFPVGVREHQQVARLAERWRGVDHEAFGDALAALLARNAQDVQQIRAAYEDWRRAPVEPPRPEPSAPPKRVSRIRPWHVAAVLFLLVIGGAVLFKERVDEQRAAIPETVTAGASAPQPSPPLPEPVPAPPPPLPAPPRKPAHEIPWLAGAVAGTLALLLLAVRRAHARRVDWLRDYRRHALEQKPGPHRFEYKVHPFAPPLPREDLEDVASIVGRTFETDASNGETLDVEESVRETLRAGLRPQLVFEPPPRNVPLIILQDLTWQMRPWQRKVDFFVSELARQGVHMERWYFEGNPLLVSRDPRGRIVPFETITARQSDASLMIVSTGQAMTVETAEELARLLAKWSFRTWLNPIGNPSYWRRELSTLPVRMWPMTGGGVRTAAVEVSRKHEVPDSPAGAARRGITRADVERMQQLIALVPHPSFELAEELRARFCDEIPEEVLLFLGEEGVFYGETIRFSDEQLEHLVGEMQRHPEEAQRVREYLLEVLRGSKPPKESVAHLRWQIEYAIHELHADDEQRVADARRTLRDLAQGPLGDEVEAALELAGAPNSEELIQAARSLPAEMERKAGMRRPPLLSWPKLHLAAAALLVIGAATATGVYWWPAGSGDPIPHRIGSYTFREEEGTPNYIASAATDDAPLKAAVFRNGRLWAPVFVSPQARIAIADADRGAWFDVRGVLAEGNYATSEMVWVAKVKPPDSGPTLPPEDLPKATATLTLTFTVTGLGSQPLRYQLVRPRGGAVEGVGGQPLEVPPGNYFLYVPFQRVTRPEAAGGVVLIERRTVRASLILKAGQIFAQSFDIAPSPDTLGGPGTPTVVVEEPVNAPDSTVPINAVPIPVSTDTGSPVAPPVGNTAPQFPATLLGDSETARRLMAVLTRRFAKELPSDFSANTQITDLEVPFDSFWSAVGDEFGITLDDNDREQSGTVEELLAVIERKLEPQSAPVAVTLTFRSTQGGVLGRVKYRLIGNSRSYDGTGGSRLRSVVPGIYHVTIEGPSGGETRLVDTIRVLAGQSLLRELRVPAAASKPPNERSGSFRLIDPKGKRAEEIWTPSGDDWTVTFPSIRAAGGVRKRIARAAVNGREGIVTMDPIGMEYFIPDDGDDVLVRPPLGRWAAYSRIHSVPAAGE